MRLVKYLFRHEWELIEQNPGELGRAQLPHIFNLIERHKVKLSHDVIVFDEVLHETGRGIEAAINVLWKQLEPRFHGRAFEIGQRVPNNAPTRITDAVKRRRFLLL